MQRAVRFYQTLGFRLLHGGPDDAFTSFAVGGSFLNLIAETHGPINWWARVIIYVSDVDALHRKMLAAGIAASVRSTRRTVERTLLPRHRSQTDTTSFAISLSSTRR